MEITETIKRKIHVEPCLKCGSTDIQFSDYGYSSFNSGGGKCKQCKHEVNSGCSCMVDTKTLVSIWNAGNNIDLLVKKQEKIIADAQKQIDELKLIAQNRIEKKD